MPLPDVGIFFLEVEIAEEALSGVVGVLDLTLSTAWHRRTDQVLAFMNEMSAIVHLSPTSLRKGQSGFKRSATHRTSRAR